MSNPHTPSSDMNAGMPLVSVLVHYRGYGYAACVVMMALALVVRSGGLFLVGSVGCVVVYVVLLLLGNGSARRAVSISDAVYADWDARQEAQEAAFVADQMLYQAVCEMAPVVEQTVSKALAYGVGNPEVEYVLDGFLLRFPLMGIDVDEHTDAFALARRQLVVWLRHTYPDWRLAPKGQYGDGKPSEISVVYRFIYSPQTMAD